MEVSGNCKGNRKLSFSHTLPEKFESFPMAQIMVETESWLSS